MIKLAYLPSLKCSFLSPSLKFFLFLQTNVLRIIFAKIFSVGYIVAHIAGYMVGYMVIYMVGYMVGYIVKYATW